jgi:hypothetical protein
LVARFFGNANYRVIDTLSAYAYRKCHACTRQQVFKCLSFHNYIYICTF